MYLPLLPSHVLGYLHLHKCSLTSLIKMQKILILGCFEAERTVKIEKGIPVPCIIHEKSQSLWNGYQRRKHTPHMQATMKKTLATATAEF